jgi:dTDP-4-dehydrorhamnose 3,5-epimerase-like enzyme
MEKKYEIVKLNAFCEPRGSLIAFQKNVNCPFDVKRCFYIFDTKKSDTLRGVHANKHSEFLLVVISGSCRVRIDTGFEKAEVLLNNPMEALYLNKMVWKEMFEFSHNAVLMVLSNELYDEKEYIRDYKTFLDLVSAKK